MAPAGSQAGRNRSSSSDDTVKVPLCEGRDTVDLPMNVGSDTVEVTHPGSGPRQVPRTDPMLATSHDLAAEGEGPSTIQVRVSENGALLEPEHGSPWYENPTLVTMLVAFAYPVGIAGTLLSATWATRLQKVVALLSVALLSMGAVALLLGR